MAPFWQATENSAGFSFLWTFFKAGIHQELPRNYWTHAGLLPNILYKSALN